MSADAQFRSLIDRILRLKEEQDTLAADIREVYAEAKGNGYDKTAMGQVVAHLRKVEKVGIAAIEEGETIFDLYLSAYQRATGTENAIAHTHEKFPPHDAVTGELTEEQEQPRVETRDAEACSPNSNAVDPASIQPDGRANPEHVDVDRSAERASSAVEVGATNSPERARSMSMTPIEPREANGLKGFGFTVTFQDPAPTPSKAAGQTGDRVTPPTLSPVAIPEYVPTFLITKPALRPHCLNPGENCGGQGVRHCHSCMKAMAESGVAA